MNYSITEGNSLGNTKPISKRPMPKDPPPSLNKKPIYVYIVIGIRENVYQDEIDGPFVSHPDKEIVRVFSNDDDARKFVTDNKLANGKREPYGDTSYYRNGYYDLEIESREVE